MVMLKTLLFYKIMNNIGIIAWALIILPGVVLGNHNYTSGSLWNVVYEDYVCDTSDGYLWLADACTFPVRKAVDYLLRYGDNSQDLYEAQDYTFNDIPLIQWNENDIIDTYLYDYESIFPYNQDKICTDYMQLARTCMTHYYTNCSSNLNAVEVDSYIDTYKDQYCDGDNLIDYIDNQRGVLETFLSGTSARAQCRGLNNLYDQIVEQTVCTDDLTFDSPYATDHDNITDYTATNPDSFNDIQDEYRSKILSAFRCVEVQMRSIGCPTSQSQSFIVYLYNKIVPPGVSVTLQEVSEIFVRPQEVDALATGEESDRPRTTCGVYGEGHLLPYGRLDDSDRLVCTFRRRWVQLLYNAFINIDAYTTYETATDLDAVYFTAVEVSVLDGSGSVLMEYSTAGGDLSTNYNILDSKTIVEDQVSTSNIAMELMTDDILRITNPLADIAVTISRYGSEYGVWVRSYSNDFGRSYGALTDGCDELDAETITGMSLNDLSSERRRRDAPDECVSACSELDYKDYKYSCIYDCTVNGGNVTRAVASSRMSESMETHYATSADSDMVQGRSGADALHYSTVMAAFLLIFSLCVCKL